MEDIIRVVLEKSSVEKSRNVIFLYFLEQLHYHHFSASKTIYSLSIGLSYIKQKSSIKAVAERFKPRACNTSELKKRQKSEFMVFFGISGSWLESDATDDIVIG